MTITQRRAIAEVLFATSLWGFGFIATVWMLPVFDPLLLNAVRFAVTFACAAPFIFYSPRLRKAIDNKQILLSMGPGFCLGIGLCLQSAGLQYTSVTNSGFITCLYVLLVPLMGRIFLGRKIHLIHLGFVALALAGTAFMVRFQPHQSFSQLNRGDLLTFAAAITISAQILWVDHALPRSRSPFMFNIFSCLWAGIASTFCMVVAHFILGIPPRFTWHISPALAFNALIGCLFLVFGSTLLGFTIQMRAQKVLEPSAAAMLFLVESPFAALYGWIFMAEHLNGTQWLGATLILIAAGGTITFEKL